MKNVTREEQIELYLNGKMTIAEQKTFEQEIAQNSELSDEIELHRHISIAFQRKGEQAFWQELRKERKSKSKLIWYCVPAVAAVAILVVLFIGFSPRHSPQELAITYYQPEDFELVPTRGEVTEREKELLNMYDNAIKSDNPSFAITVLQDLSEIPDFEYYEESQWRLLLYYLEMDKLREAQILTDKMILENSFFADKAQEIRNKLKEKKWF